MKAAVLFGIGDIRYSDVPLPKLNDGEVLVGVKFAGVCGSDIPRVMEKGTYSLPLIPGHEFSGEVVDTSKSLNKKFKPGDRVAVFPLIPCRRCPYCQIGEYAQCDSYDYLGSRRNGGFAEYVAVPEENLFLLPDNVDLDYGAMAEPVSVALHSVRRTGVDIGDNVAILGAGTIGLILAQWVRIAGAKKIFLTDIEDKRLDIAKDLGFKDCLNTRDEEPVAWILDNTGGRGVDICIEAAGSPVTLNQALRMTRKLGKIVLMGNISKDVVVPEDLISTILRGQLTIYGTWNSSITVVPKNEWETSLSFMSSGALNLKPLITHKLPLSQVKEAFDMMHNKREFFCKVMFRI